MLTAATLSLEDGSFVIHAMRLRPSYRRLLPPPGRSTMTETTGQRTYRTRTGRLLTDADIERIAEEVEVTDCDLTRAKNLCPPEPS